MKQDQAKPRAKRTKAERRELLAELRASGESVSKFARERGLATSSVYQWVRAQKEAKAKVKKRKTPNASESTFTEVSVVGPMVTAPSSIAGLTVALRCGHTVTFEGQRLDLAWLKSVLKAVSAC